MLSLILTIAKAHADENLRLTRVCLPLQQWHRVMVENNDLMLTSTNDQYQSLCVMVEGPNGPIRVCPDFGDIVIYWAEKA